MKNIQERRSALTGSACPEKANDTSHQYQSASHDGYVAPQRTCRHVGDRQCIQVGDFGTAVAGERGHAMAGESGFALAGDRGTARAGDFGTAMVGEFGQAVAGDGGLASTSDFGTAQAGFQGIARGGYRASVAAGMLGEIHLIHWDSAGRRWRTAVGYIGEDGLLADTFYTLDSSHQFVPARPDQEVAR
ncbi:TPA: hypothetical protein ACQT1A_001513 [Pseudomonas aeruginosa]|uniref:hypothetical protein n=1 Tax=Pseudomonas aeruginosa TaxID=287 RepID=UPI0004DE1FEB|nr:hypothetical protein [Pseudomonas aeruginosa]EKP5708733.1 hypothetical protein [Pseudomonas aeruginosa]ELQ4884373.1 hypothetical protein [Pseudomonas aeruginosa]KSE75283.1 hypothetical protein AO918_02445 [Pseudomonas aeruginosa]KSH18018.1 hypothetical protein AO963_24000 [Pseudomonas aeruginosa]KSO07089.1 hypothetical protein APA88_00570 [Pseudomonas aeruginosa]